MLKYILLTVAALLLMGCAARQSGEAPMEVKTTDLASLEAVKAYQEGDRTKGLALYRALVKENPKNPVFQNNLGVLLLESGQAKAALEAFESASLVDPGNANYMVNVGLAQIRLGDNDAAMGFFDRALQLKPGFSRVFYGKGVAFLVLKEPEIALGFFRKASAADPSDQQSLFMKAYASQQNSLWMDAIRDYSAFLGQSDDTMQKANALSNRALCYFQLKDSRKGMADLDQAIKLNDESPIYFYNRAQGYQMRQDYENAVKDYTRAISRKAEFPEAYVNRGELYYLLGKEVKACSDLKRACDLGVCAPLEKYESKGKCSD
ncbi:MAG: tetratricopeptide repeat protein [Pseudodesulfovibrio sp.]